MERRYIDRVSLKKEVNRQSYLFRLPVVQYLMKQKDLSFDYDVTFLVGENGTGKSTLLEAMAVAYGFNAEGGSRNFDFSTNRTHSELNQLLTLSRRGYAKDGFFLRAESFYNVATNIEALDRIPGTSSLLDSYGGKSLHAQSHGESFMALLQNRFFGKGLYLLDEPEAALSPSRQLTLMAGMQQLIERDSQFIIATHSPMLMTFPGAHIYQLGEDGIESVSYRDTEHYQLTRRFLENPDRIFQYLFEE